MNSCKCGAPVELGNPDLGIFQCERCWEAWSRWVDAHRDQPLDAWPGIAEEAAA